MFLLAVPILAQDPGWIGISIEDQTDGGAIIRRVEPNSPAGKAGLRAGDVILEFNNQAVIGAQQLTRLVRETPVGRGVDVKVRREGGEQTLRLTTERAAGLQRFDFDFPGVVDRVIRSVPSVEVSTSHVHSGIRVQQLSDQLRDFFGVFGDNGVLVTSVDQGSAAEKAGLKAGDVIVSIDGRNIRSTAEFSREMGARSNPVMKIVRDKQEREIKFE